MSKLTCKKDFEWETFKFEKGKSYDYWINFGGLNHIVKYNEEEVFPFDGPNDDPCDDIIDKDRPWIYDYFYTIEELRDYKINIINE